MHSQRFQIQCGNIYAYFTAQEMERLDLESRGFILFLEQIKVLTPETREMVIDRGWG